MLMGQFVQGLGFGGGGQAVGIAGLLAEPLYVGLGVGLADADHRMVGVGGVVGKIRPESLPLGAGNFEAPQGDRVCFDGHRFGQQHFVLAIAVEAVGGGGFLLFQQRHEGAALFYRPVGGVGFAKEIGVKPAQFFFYLPGLVGQFSQPMRLPRKPKEAHRGLTDLLQGPVIFPALVAGHGPVFAAMENDGGRFDLLHFK